MYKNFLWKNSKPTEACSFNYKANIASSENAYNAVSAILSSNSANNADVGADLPSGAKCILTARDGKISVKSKSSKDKYGTYIMPDITNVEVKNDRVVFVSFSDGTTEKAVLSKYDVFDIEFGISICITKKIISQKSHGNESSIYNKIIRRAIKVHKAKLREKESAKAEAERVKMKYKKIAAKKEKRKVAQREARINENAEAYRRALKSLNTSSEG